MNKCAYCGLDTGFYIKSRVSGVIKINYKFNGKPDYNFEMWDSVEHKDQKRMFCQECDRPLGLLKDTQT